MRSSRQFQTSLFKKFTSTKAKTAYKRTKIKAHKKHLRKKKTRLFAYLRFVLLLGCVFVLFVLFVHVKFFCKKKNKEFKTALMTSFTLLPLLLSRFLIMIQISETALFFLKNERSIEKAPPTKAEGFPMSFFDLSQTCEIAFTENS